MDRDLKDLHPRIVFRYFQEISNIPRASGNEELISNYLVEFAKRHSLTVTKDDNMNVIIKKPGTKGYEKSKSVILQAHMDMVCDKYKSSDHDFLKDPIRLRVEGDYLMADGTTLGADNGIALAYYLTVLSSTDYYHPPLEVLITAGEESGMKGASKIDASHLSGKILINMDTWIDGTLIVGCSGAARNKVILPITWEKSPRSLVPFLVKIDGLKGGHSGTDIHRGRGNANKLMGRLLKGLSGIIDIYIAGINGGSKYNAIARETEVIILIDPSQKEELFRELDYWSGVFKRELVHRDNGVRISVEEVKGNFCKVFSRDTTNRLISLITLMPQGPQVAGNSLNNALESSCNVAVVNTLRDEIIIGSSVRSSLKSLKYSILDQISSIVDLVNGKFILENDYPEWECNSQSYIRDLCIDVYRNMFGRKPKIAIVHSGLECGILGEKLGNVEMISFGPQMIDVHTPAEKLSISSAKKTFQYLVEVLRRINY